MSRRVRRSPLQEDTMQKSRLNLKVRVLRRWLLVCLGWSLLCCHLFLISEQNHDLPFLATNPIGIKLTLRISFVLVGKRFYHARIRRRMAKDFLTIDRGETKANWKNPGLKILWSSQLHRRSSGWLKKKPGSEPWYALTTQSLSVC